MNSQFSAGDEVHVMRWRVSGPRRIRSYRGTVTGAGAGYGTVTFEVTRSDGQGVTRTEQLTAEFDLETGRERAGWPLHGMATLVKTLEQAALERRRHAAETILFRAGIQVADPERLPVEQIEALAETAKTIPAYDRLAR